MYDDTKGTVAADLVGELAVKNGDELTALPPRWLVPFLGVSSSEWFELAKPSNILARFLTDMEVILIVCALP